MEDQKKIFINERLPKKQRQKKSDHPDNSFLGKSEKKALKNSRHTDSRREGGLSGASEVTGELGFVKMKLNQAEGKTKEEKKKMG